MKTRIKWVDMKDRIKNAVLLASVAMFASLPMFYSQFLNMSGSIFPNRPTSHQIFYLSLSQSFIVFALALLCALIWFLYAERLRLPGFGKPSDLIAWVPVGLIAGLATAPVMYFCVEKDILGKLPELARGPWYWAVANMLGESITQEIIMRLGLLTIALYFADRWRLKGHPWPAVVLISIFGASGSYFSLAKFNLADKIFMYQMVTTLILAFIIQCVFCEIYLRKGFLATVSFHFGMSVKFLLYAIIPV